MKHIDIYIAHMYQFSLGIKIPSRRKTEKKKQITNLASLSIDDTFM